jgi:CrcB protein
MLWYIAAGSAIGGVARYLLGGMLQRQTGATFPIDTPTLSAEARAFLTVGFCGGYTTFSTFSYETVALMEDGQWPRAAGYVALSVGLSLVGVFLGIATARELLALRVRS